MEKESGCKISIRGKGSVKSGARGPAKGDEVSQRASHEPGKRLAAAALYGSTDTRHALAATLTPHNPYSPSPPPPFPQEDELHVLITGDTDEQADRAVELCMPLLQPVDDSTNEHKLRQLKELSIINGTVRCDSRGLRGLRGSRGLGGGVSRLG